jgi:hypothetical protein
MGIPLRIRLPGWSVSYWQPDPERVVAPPPAKLPVASGA